MCAIQVDIHRREVAGMLTEVESVEHSNVEVMAQLFECTVDDLKVSRYAFSVIVQ